MPSVRTGLGAPGFYGRRRTRGIAGKLVACNQHAYAVPVVSLSDTCIDCDLCRQIAPSMTRGEADHSFVAYQPQSASEVIDFDGACCVSTVDRTRQDRLPGGRDRLPRLIGKNVYFCGCVRNSYGVCILFRDPPGMSRVIHSIPPYPLFNRTAWSPSRIPFSTPRRRRRSRKVHNHFRPARDYRAGGGMPGTPGRGRTSTLDEPSRDPRAGHTRVIL
jgi:hypothetical protein